MHSSPTSPTVPVATSGHRLEGWTSCCGACVTFADYGALCCKACWHEVNVQALHGEASDRLNAICYAVMRGEMTAEAGVASQRDLVGYPSVEAASIGSRPR